jgi:inhibitor of KinA sporulation pathway (predicted exonuclease)
MRDIIVFDIECTCWDDLENRNRDERETIEIGAALLDGTNFDPIDFFDVMIKPVNNTVLSKYCTDLTTITQAQVDKGMTFADALDYFQRWYTFKGNPLFLTWGYFDKNHLVMESEKKDYHGQFVYDILQHGCHVNVKQKFAEHMDCDPCGVSKALRKLQIKFEGTQHRGIDDAKNIAKIAKHIKYQIPQRDF